MTRSRQHRTGSTSPLDAPAYRAPGDHPVDDVEAALGSGAYPLIAPPVLLEPVPPPVLLGKPEPAHTDPEPVDAYTLAAAAASAMEREGRTFDSALELGDLPPEDDPVEVVTLREYDTPEADEVEPRPDPPRRTAAKGAAPVVVRTPPRPPPARPEAPPRVSTGMLGLVTGLAIAVLVVTLAGIGMMMRGDGGGADVLRPVSHDLDALAGSRSRGRFSSPPAEAVPANPDGVVDLRPRTVVHGAPGTGVVHVTTDPPGAVVRIDGRVHGRTPIDVDLAFGAYSAELQLDGHGSVRKILTVDQREQELSATLPPDLVWGRARVVAPGWDGAVLMVDGKEVGTVPATVDLQTGDHTFLALRGDDELEVKRTLILTRDQMVRVDLTK
jgi:hypothetical protein